MKILNPIQGKFIIIITIIIFTIVVFFLFVYLFCGCVCLLFVVSTVLRVMLLTPLFVSLTDTLETRAVQRETRWAGAAERSLGVDTLTTTSADTREQLTLVDVCEKSILSSEHTTAFIPLASYTAALFLFCFVLLLFRLFFFYFDLVLTKLTDRFS